MQGTRNLIHQFHLSPRGNGGIFCDEGGAFIGAIPLLARTRRNGKDEWRPRDCDDLSQEMSAQYGLPVDMSSKRGGLTVIARALNEGDLVRAQIATVLLGVPDPPSLSKGAPSRQQRIQLASDLCRSRLLKADWDPDEHPRWPAGAPDSQGGGQFAPKGDGETGASPISQANTTDRAGSENPRPDRALPDTRIQLADAGVSDAADDPVAQAATRADEAQRNADAQAGPANSEHQGFWQRLGSELSDGTKALIAEIGREQIEQSDADLAVATAEADAIAQAVRAFAEYRAQPWLGSDGQPMQVPVINTGDPLSDQAALMGHLLFEPNAPLMRPATNADWIDPLVNVVSLAATAVGPAFRLAGPAADAIDGVEVSANAAESAFATTEGVAVSGGRAIDRGASYEIGVRKMYGDLPISERKFKFFMDGRKVSGIADNTTSIDGKLTAVEVKYVDDWATSLRNPASENGGKPWAVDEQQTMIRQAKAYSQYFSGGIVYHTNSVDLAAYYTNVFRNSGVRNFRFVITPATEMGKKMAKNYMERIFGAGAFERKVPGTGPGEDASVRYVSFDDPASIPKLFDEVLDKIEPNLMKSGGAILEGTKLELPDGGHFFAILFSDDLEGWRKQTELGAKELGRATARVVGSDVIVSDGRSYPLSSCKVEFQ
jgi:hypothetical protein